MLAEDLDGRVGVAQRSLDVGGECIVDRGEDGESGGSQGLKLLSTTDNIQCLLKLRQTIL